MSLTEGRSARDLTQAALSKKNQHLPAFVFCLFCVVVWFCCFGVFLFPVFALLCFWFLFCKCLGIPNSPRSLDLDDRQGLVARSAMQQKKKLFFKKGRGYPEAKVPEDLWGCNRENIFTGKPWDGVGAKGREPVFRVKIIIEKALLCGKKNRTFLVKVTSFVGEVLGDRETFIFSGKREGRGTAWRLGRPTYKVGREGVLRLDHQGLFGVNVLLTHGGGGKVVAARDSKQCPPRGVRGVHSGSRVGRWVREVDDVHMGSMKREGVKGKTENNARVTRQRAVPFEMFGIHLPFITWRKLGASGEVEEVGGRAVGETHDKGEEAPRAEISDLMSNLPTVVIKC